MLGLKACTATARLPFQLLCFYFTILQYLIIIKEMVDYSSNSLNSLLLRQLIFKVIRRCVLIVVIVLLSLGDMFVLSGT